MAFFLALFFSSSLKAQFLPAISREDLAKEPPITEMDVLFTIQYFQQVKRFNEDQDEGAVDRIFEFLENSGFTIQRQSYAYQKTTAVLSVLNGELTMEELDEPYLKFNDDERRVVAENLSLLNDSIRAAYPPK
jgi:hypothetical protein